MAINLSSYQDYVLVGDLMKSVTLLQIKPGSTTSSENYRFREVARHYEPMWMTDAEILDENTCIGVEAEGNMAVFQYDTSESAKQISGDDEPILDVIACMRIGEIVNRVRRSM